MQKEREDEEEKEEAPLIRMAVAVLPWLSAKDLASLACSCSAMARVVASITHRRMADLARGLEAWPVPVINRVDHFLYPYFSYTPSSCLPSHHLAQPWGCIPPVNRPGQGQMGINPFGLPGSNATGCHCARNCSGSIAATDADSVSTSSDASDASFDFVEQHNRVDEQMGNGFGKTSEQEEDIRTLRDDLVGPPALKKQRRSPFAEATSCPCGRTLYGELAYDSNFRLRFFGEIGKNLTKDYGTPSILECGAACSCNLSCKYRLTQHGLAVKVAVVRDSLKGWKLQAAQFIARGSFVCDYAGELLTTAEAQRRQKMYDRMRMGGQKCGSALLVLREHLPSGQACLRLNIDATQVGNVARFMNHACDGGNLLPCLVRLTGLVIPKLALFASKDIFEGEELTFSYGETQEGLQMQPCFCGTAACKGFMPSEET